MKKLSYHLPQKLKEGLDQSHSSRQINLIFESQLPVNRVQEETFHKTYKRRLDNVLYWNLLEVISNIWRRKWDLKNHAFSWILSPTFQPPNLAKHITRNELPVDQQTLNETRPLKSDKHKHSVMPKSVCCGVFPPLHSWKVWVKMNISAAEYIHVVSW